MFLRAQVCVLWRIGVGMGTDSEEDTMTTGVGVGLFEHCDRFTYEMPPLWSDWWPLCPNCAQPARLIRELGDEEKKTRAAVVAVTHLWPAVVMAGWVLDAVAL